MPVSNPTKTNFLYRFEYGSTVRGFTAVAEGQQYSSETYYSPLSISHTAPTFSAEPSASEIDVEMDEDNAVADLFGVGPPPYRILLLIYEYDTETEAATPYWRGWVIRSSLNLTKSTVSFHCKTVWHFFERESFTDSLSALSRYSIYDPRSGVDIEVFRRGVTVTALNDERDVVTVSGLTEIDDWATGGMMVAPDRDKRTILKHETVGADKVLTLTAAFPEFTLAVGFPADVYPGDNLLYATWANKFDAGTNNGEAFGGWPYMPNVDPAVRGVF